MLTPKQLDTLRKSLGSHYRYNISCGAVRSGKSFIDLFRIPIRLRRLSPCENAAIIGNTRSSVVRNVIDPLRNLWGSSLVGQPHDGKVRLFGRECLILGADRSDCAEKIQGMSLGYVCGDEITTWSEDFFRMLQSRLDKNDSVFDGSCNPDAPNHWFKKFLDKSDDVLLSEFTLDDNPALPEDFVKSLKNEYRGTVYYDRFILGKWRSCNGVVYRQFADDPDRFIIDSVSPDEIIAADIGVDFGGNGSAHAFVLTGYSLKYKKIITLDEYYRKDIISPAQLEEDFVSFVKRCKEKYPRVYDVYCDSAEQVLIKGLKNAAAASGLGVAIRNAAKKKISDRICFYLSIMAQNRFFILKNCSHTIDAFLSAEYDRDGLRKDNGSSNIDSLDAQEYSTEHRMSDILEHFVFLN